MRDTDTDWNVISVRNPYWAVLSVEKYLGGDISANDKAEFFASGEHFISDLLGMVNKHFGHFNSQGTALDFGCGVGRLVIPLARRFAQVIGVDIADPMLALARTHVQDAGLDNVVLQKADAVLGAREVADFVNSFIVIQHIPPARRIRIVRDLIAMCRIGGLCSLQLTYARGRQFLLHEQPAAAFYRREGSHLVDLIPSENTHPHGTITMYDYDLNEVFALVSQHAEHPIIVLPTDNDSHIGVHLIFRRAA